MKWIRIKRPGRHKNRARRDQTGTAGSASRHMRVLHPATYAKAASIASDSRSFRVECCGSRRSTDSRSTREINVRPLRMYESGSYVRNGPSQSASSDSGTANAPSSSQPRENAIETDAAIADISTPTSRGPPTYEAMSETTLTSNERPTHSTESTSKDIFFLPWNAEKIFKPFCPHQPDISAGTEVMRPALALPPWQAACGARSIGREGPVADAHMSRSRRTTPLLADTARRELAYHQPTDGRLPAIHQSPAPAQRPCHALRIGMS